jgi:hypothetical protein
MRNEAELPVMGDGFLQNQPPGSLRSPPSLVKEASFGGARRRNEVSTTCGSGWVTTKTNAFELH